MSVEDNPQNKAEYIDPVERMKAEGWVLVGRERLTETKFSTDARFIEVPYQTEESIKARHLQELQQMYPDRRFEIILVLDEGVSVLARMRESASQEEYQQVLDNLEDKNKSFLVFARQLPK